jgi:hypothetical protein
MSLVTSSRPAGPRSASAAAATRGRSRQVLLVTHVTTGVSLIGADLAVLALGISGWAGADPRAAYPAMSLVATWLLGPLAVVALGSGLLLATRGGWGLLRHAWVTIKLAVTATLTALVVFVVRPGLARAADAGTGLDPQAVLTEAQRLLYAVTPAATLTLLVLNVALGVVKPALWTRAGRRDRRGGPANSPTLTFSRIGAVQSPLSDAAPAPHSHGAAMAVTVDPHSSPSAPGK